MSNPKLLDYFEAKIKALLSRKVDKVPGKGLSTEDYTTAEKTKLAGIPAGGGGTVDTAMSDLSTNAVQNRVIKSYVDGRTVTVDSALSTTSMNPVQNRVIKAALDDIDPAIIDDELSSTSEDPVQNKVITSAITSINNNANLCYSGDVSFKAIDPISPNNASRMGGVLDSEIVAKIGDYTSNSCQIMDISNGAAHYGCILQKVSNTYFSGMIWSYHLTACGKTVWWYAYYNGEYYLRPLANRL